MPPRETASINCTFYGTDGVLAVDENAVKLMNATTNGWKQVTTWEWKDSFRDAFLSQAVGIADWLDGTVEEYRGGAKNAYAVMEIMMALYESARLKEITKLPLQTDRKSTRLNSSH